MTGRAFAALVTTALLGACDAPPAPTGQATVATLVEGCTDCAIEVQATIEFRDHPDFPTGLPTDVTYRAGRYYVVYSESPARIVVYDSLGNPESAWGSEGQGPGEVRLIQSIEWSGDSLHVLDGANSRHLVLDEALDVARETRIEVRPGTRSGAIVNGGLVVAGRPLDPDERSALHHIDDEGTVIRSVLELGEHALGHVHSIEPLTNGDLLVGRYWDRSIFVVGSGESDKASTLSQRPEWFGPVAPRRVRRVAEGGRVPPPHAALRDIAVDSMGVLWALSQHPRDDWRKRAGDDDRPPADARVRAVIEALDAATGEVLRHLEVDAFPVLLARGGEVVLYETLETGLPRVVLARFRSMEVDAYTR